MRLWPAAFERCRVRANGVEPSWTPEQAQEVAAALTGRQEINHETGLLADASELGRGLRDPQQRHQEHIDGSWLIINEYDKPKKFRLKNKNSVRDLLVADWCLPVVSSQSGRSS